MAQPKSHLDIGEISARFQRNVDDIAKDFIAAYSLKFRQEVENLNSPLLRWLDFRFRYIDPQSRQAIFSDNFPKKDLPEEANAGLRNLVRLIQSGADINPYQGRGLVLRNDTSSQRNDSRTDLLWADWNIHHFHLSAAPIPEGQFFSLPADYLAFCIVGGDLVAFIDVLRHPDNLGFSNPDLLATIRRNWPDYMEQFRLSGLMAEAPRSMEEIHTLRSHGVNHMMSYEGQIYMGPGMGITSASTSMRITMANDHVRRNVQGLAQLVCDPEEQFQSLLRGNRDTKPNFRLAVTPRGLCVYEETSEAAFLLPRSQPHTERSFLADLHDAIAPPWAVHTLTAPHAQQEGPYD